MTFEPTLNGIAPETQQYIYSFLPIRDFANVSQVDHRSQAACQEVLNQVATQIAAPTGNEVLDRLAWAQLGLSEGDLAKAVDVLSCNEHFKKMVGSTEINAVNVRHFFLRASYSDLFILFFSRQGDAFLLDSLLTVGDCFLARKKPKQEDLHKINVFLNKHYPPDALALRKELRRHCLGLKQFSVLRLLVDRREQHQQDTGNCLIFKALQNGDKQRAIRLVKEGNHSLNILNYGRGLLHGAIQMGDLDFFKLLVQHGAFINLKSSASGDTPLIEFMTYIGGTLHLTQEERRDFYTYLVLNGIDIDAPDVYKKTPLVTAFERNNLGLSLLFLDLGADPNLKDEEGETLLYRAAQLGGADYRKDLARDGVFDAESTLYLEYIEGFLKAGADPNVKNKNGRTPLHEAAQGGELPYVEALVRGGASTTVRDKKKNTPMQLAGKEKHVNIVSYLVKAARTPQTSSLPSINDLVRILVKDSPAQLMQEIHELKDSFKDFSNLLEKRTKKEEEIATQIKEQAVEILMMEQETEELTSILSSLDTNTNPPPKEN